MKIISTEKRIKEVSIEEAAHVAGGTTLIPIIPGFPSNAFSVKDIVKGTTGDHGRFDD